MFSLYFFRLSRVITVLSLLAFTPLLVMAAEHSKDRVHHLDPIEVDKALNLAQVVELTLEKYPDVTWLKALEEEASAISERGKSLTAGASQINLNYQTEYSNSLHYGTATVQVPLWNLGQRDAENELAEKARNSAQTQATSLKLRVAGLVRAALWDMALANTRFQQAQLDLETNEKLVAKVKRRVELGDLPRADELLAQTELLQKRSAFTLAEAELMHTRKRYGSITQMTKIPANYEEKLVDLTEISQNHPALLAVNDAIERKQAEFKAIKLVGSGQSSVTAGLLSDEGMDDRSNHAEFFGVGVTVPFGGEAHLAPQLAAINVEVNKLMAERDLLFRDLEQAHHEAEHNMQINEVELNTANEQRKVSEEYLQMMQTAFSVGEITLTELLIVQAKTQQAVLNAKQRGLIVQRDIALYNQAVGVMP